METVKHLGLYFILTLSGNGRIQRHIRGYSHYWACSEWMQTTGAAPRFGAPAQAPSRLVSFRGYMTRVLGFTKPSFEFGNLDGIRRLMLPVLPT